MPVWMDRLLTVYITGHMSLNYELWALEITWDLNLQSGTCILPILRRGILHWLITCIILHGELVYIVAINGCLIIYIVCRSITCLNYLGKGLCTWQIAGCFEGLCPFSYIWNIVGELGINAIDIKNQKGKGTLSQLIFP